MATFKKYDKTYRIENGIDYFYLENLYNGNTTLSVTKNGTPSSTDLQYSLDKVTWIDCYNGISNVAVPQGGKVYLRSSTGLNNGNESNYFRLYLNNNFGAGGDIRTLFNYTDVDSVTTIPNYGCNSIFNGKTNLVQAHKLSFEGVKTVNQYGLTKMFYGCTNLITTPDLSSLSSIGYRSCKSMFSQCTSLTAAPKIKTITCNGSQCFEYMFSNCTSLKVPLDLRGVTDSGQQYRYMYKDCTSLNMVYAPNIGSWNDNNTWEWVDNVASNGVFLKSSKLATINHNKNCAPVNWSVINY